MAVARCHIIVATIYLGIYFLMGHVVESTGQDNSIYRNIPAEHGTANEIAITYGYENTGQAMEFILTNLSKLLRVYYLLGLVLSSSSAISNERKTGSQANLNWTTLLEEVNKTMSIRHSCRMGHYFCEFPFSGEDTHSPFLFRRPIRLCDCSDQCMIYGGCCSDEAARQANRGVKVQSEKYMCGYLQLSSRNAKFKRVVMVRNCLEIFVGSNVENLCFKQPSDVLYDPLLDLPVISFKTNVTYLNYYCAQCNNDAMNLVPMVYKMECVTRSPPGIPHKYLYSLKFPSANDFATGEITAPQHYLLSEAQEEYFGTSGFGNEGYVLAPKYFTRKGKWEFFGNSTDLSLSCIIKRKKYKHFGDLRKNYETSPCSIMPKLDQIQECNEKWENKEDFEKCRSYSLTALINDTEYKNPDCARCNFEDMSLLELICDFVHGVKRPLFSIPKCATGWQYDNDVVDCVQKLW